MWTAANFLLLSYIFMAIFAPISLMANGFILTVIMTNASLRKDHGLYLLAALSIADFLLALFVLPYTVYLLHGWHTEISYDPLTMMILNLPVVFEIKINSVLTVAIAFDRFSAIYWPVSYRQRQKDLYTGGAMAIGTLWALIDGTFCFVLSAPFVPKSGCGAAGCYMNDDFQYYWGVSDMFINALAMAITILFLFKVRTYGQPQNSIPAMRNNSIFNKSSNHNELEGTKFKNVRTSFIGLKF